MINAVPQPPANLGQAAPTLGGQPGAGSPPTPPTNQTTTTTEKTTTTVTPVVPVSPPAAASAVPATPVKPVTPAPGPVPGAAPNPVMPPKPAAPTPPAAAPVPATVTTTTTTTIPVVPPAAPTAKPSSPPVGGPANPTVSPPSPKKPKYPVKGIIAALALLVVVVGGGLGLWAVRMNQETRQQASVGVTTPGCGAPCTDNSQCPAAHTCSSSGRCILTACTQPGVQCDTAQCVRQNVGACSLNFVALAPPTQIMCDKVPYRDEFTNSAGNYTFTQQQTTFDPGDVVVFRINLTNQGSSSAQIALSDSLNIGNLNNFTFMDSNCGANAYDSTTRVLTCPTADASPGASIVRAFRVRLAQTIAAGTTLTNTATASAGQTSRICMATVTVAGATPSPSPSPSTTPSTYTCDSPCTNDEQCRTANAAYVCDSVAGNRCRLDSNRTSETCTPPANTYTCNSPCTSDEQCRTASSSYVCSSGYCRLDSNPTANNCLPANNPSPSPAVGCNEVCVTNSDCAAANQICADTTSGKRCRLENYINSETCTTSTTVVYTTPVATTAPQPVQPTELPKAGAVENTIRFVVIGGAAVLIGALGLLLL